MTSQNRKFAVSFKAEDESPVRWEDQIQKICDKFHKKSCFIRFAESCHGLGMATDLFKDAEIDYSGNFKKLKQEIVGLWRQNYGQDDKNATSSEKLESACNKFCCHPTRTRQPEESFYMNLLCYKKLIITAVLIAFVSIFACKHMTERPSTSLTEYTIRYVPLRSSHYMCQTSEATHSLVAKVNNNTRDMLPPEGMIHPLKSFNSSFMDPQNDRYYRQEMYHSSPNSESPFVVDDLIELYEGSGGHSLRHVTLIGPRGSGKTEFLKTISWSILKMMEISSKFEILLYIDLQEISQQTMTASELLFGGLETDSKNATHCLVHSKNILLVLDHVNDHISNSFNASVLNCLNCKTAVSNIVVNILRGNISPSMKILSSTHSKMMKHMRGKMKPEKIIGLKGLSKDGIEKQFSNHGFDKKCWKDLRRITIFPHPTLLKFIITTAKKCQFESETNALLQAVYKINKLFIYKETERSYSYLQKLMNISFELTKSGQEIFYDGDAGISKEDIQRYKDLGLVTGSGRYHFSHQSIHDLLAALLVIEMPINKFEKFTEEIHGYKWTAVRKMIMEILLDPVTFKVLQFTVSDKMKLKIIMLKLSLQKELERLQKSSRFKLEYLEFLHLLRQFKETAKEILFPSLKQINFVNVALTMREVDTLIHSINHAEEMILVNMINCQIGRKFLKSLAKIFSQSSTYTANRTKIRILNIGNYQELPQDGVEDVLRIIPFVSDVLWLGYQVNPKGLREIQGIMNLLRKPAKTVLWTVASRRMVILEPE